VVLAPLFPWATLRLLGDAERLKFGTMIVRPIMAVWLKLPEVPVTVMVAVPAAAEVPAANVRVLVPVVLAGLKDAVTPLGRPVAARLTLPLKPFSGLTEMVVAPLFPWATLRLLGDAERLKFGTMIVRPIVAVWLKLPEVPVTVTVAVPAVTEAPAATNVRLLVPVVLAGLNDAVTPFGRPDAAKLTLPLKAVLRTDGEGTDATVPLDNAEAAGRCRQAEVRRCDRQTNRGCTLAEFPKCRLQSPSPFQQSPNRRPQLSECWPLQCSPD
jgi:hypothetical protein